MPGPPATTELRSFRAGLRLDVHRGACYAASLGFFTIAQNGSLLPIELTLDALGYHPGLHKQEKGARLVLS